MGLVVGRQAKAMLDSVWTCGSPRAPRKKSLIFGIGQAIRSRSDCWIMARLTSAGTGRP